MGKKLEGEPVNNSKYINPKLITWDGEILKIGSVYRQESNYHLQVFLKECKYAKRDTSFKSQFSDDEEDSRCYDTVN